jgi:hypothetical protein
MATDADPSQTGFSVTTESAVPATAIATPISAAESSRKTVKEVGSLLRRTACQMLWRPLVLRNELAPA